MKKALGLWVDLFPLWVVLGALLAWFFPGAFARLTPGIVPGLGVIMFGMGMTLLPEDFWRVLKMPRAVACGVLGQFLIMPLLAVGLSRLFSLSPELTMGFIILGSCPGGTASNVIAYLARADVALSVTMTACSTLLAVVATPFLIWYLGGAYLPVDPWGILWDVVKMVLLPVLAGLFLHVRYERGVNRILPFFPALSVLIIVLIIAAIIGAAHDRLAQVVGVVGLVVVLHNTCGLLLGYGLAGVFLLPEKARRTIAIEVGMQNSGLAVALAATYFTPLAALPGSLFSVVHNLSGSLLAGYWRRKLR